MAVILVVVLGAFLVGAVCFGLWHNSKRGKPAAGLDQDGKAKNSS